MLQHFYITNSQYLAYCIMLRTRTHTNGYINVVVSNWKIMHIMPSVEPGCLISIMQKMAC